MKLFIKREQAKGFLGGVKFELNAKVDLTEEELGLVNKYQVGKEVLLKKEVNFLGNKIPIDITIGSLIFGQKFKCNGISEILEYEKNIKESCEVFKLNIEIMRSFGGEEIIEFT